jgi:thermitase
MTAPSVRPARLTLALAVGSALLGSALGASAQSARPADIPVAGKAFSAQAANRIVAGRLLIVAKPGITDAVLDKRLALHGSKRLLGLGKRGMHVVSATEGSEQALLAALKDDPAILSAELDRKVALHFIPNDPSFSSQYAPKTVQAPAAWDITQGAGETIAILDTGTESTHPDLAANMVAGYNFYDNNTDTSDVYGHGTATAGTAAAVGNNGVGVSGICPQCKIMPLRISDLNGYAYYSTMTAAINYAADHGVKVANLSFGGVDSSTVANAASYLRSKGGVLVMSAGNDGVNQTSFTNWGSITAVSATDSNNTITSWSSYGSYVDMAAPGASILTTSRGAGYNYWSGTSFSSPIVAGVYALVHAANPALSPDQMDSIVFNTAVDLGAPGVDIQYGHGLANAAAAVNAARQAMGDTVAPSVSFASPAPGSKLSGIATLSANAADNVGIARVDLLINGVLIGSATAAPYAFAFDTSAYKDGSVSLTLQAYDGAGNLGSNSASYTIANDSIAPVVSIASPTQGQTASGKVQIAASATDNMSVASMSITIDGKQVAISNSGSIGYTWSVPAFRVKQSHTSTIVVQAKDPAGNSSTQSVTVLR